MAHGQYPIVHIYNRSADVWMRVESGEKMKYLTERIGLIKK